MKNKLSALKAAAWSSVAVAAASFDQLKDSATLTKVAAVAAGAAAVSWLNEIAQEVMPFYGALVAKVRGKLHGFFSDSAD